MSARGGGLGSVGVPKSDTARPVGVHWVTVKRSCNQLDGRGTLQPRKAPSKKPKVDGKANKQPR